MISLKGSFEEARFEAELIPHRSIGMRGAQCAIAFTGLLLGTSTAIAGFASGGKALPVIIPFALAIQTGIAWAFMCNARDACERQILTMDNSGLTLTHTRPNWKKPVITKIDAPPLARIEEKSIRGIKKLTLCLHKQEIPLGRFLPPAETANLQQNLKLALRNWTKDISSVPL